MLHTIHLLSLSPLFPFILILFMFAVWAFVMSDIFSLLLWGIFKLVGYLAFFAMMAYMRVMGWLYIKLLEQKDRLTSGKNVLD